MQDFTLIKFPVVGRKDILVAATLRPETIFGQTNMWVNPDIEYVRARVDGESWIISKQAAEKLSYQKKKVKVLESVKGRDLIGEYVKAPGVKESIPVFPSEFCDPDIGTGIVTSVPSDAPYDWIALRDLQENKEVAEKYSLDWGMIKKIKVIPIIQTKEFGEAAAVEISERMKIKNQKEKAKLDEATKVVYKEGFHKGVMNKNCGKYKGMKVEKAKDLVRKALIKKGQGSSMTEFTEPVVCRCGGKVVVASTESWFIDYSQKKWKKLAIQNLKDLKNVPRSAEKDFAHTIDWLGEWPCVRNFGLGTPLPQDPKFIIEPLSDSTIYMAFYILAHVIKRYKSDQLKKEFFDFVMIGKGNVDIASKKTGIPSSELRDLKKQFDYWYPLDWRCSALELIPNHLTFMIFHHTAIFPRAKWPQGIATWGMGLLEGGKMSSSKGNVVLASDAIEEFSADAVRFYLFSSVEPWQDFDWRAKEVKVVKDRLDRWFELVQRLSKKGKEQDLSLIDKWLISEMNQIIKNTSKSLDGFESRKASLECFFRMNEAVKWYLRRAGEVNKVVIWQVLENWIKLMSPFVPHMCEELWESLAKEGFVSTSSWPVVDSKVIDPRLDKMEDLVRQTSDDINSITKILKKNPKEVKIYVSPRWKYVFYNKVLGMASKPGEIISAIMKDPESRKQGKDALRFAEKLARNAGKLGEVLKEEEEFSVLGDARHFLEKEFKCKIKIYQSYEAQNQKALRAEPGKPGIEVIA
jgi:leucyl-tRNA synthetase